MHYEHVVYGTFDSRPNRFIARVWVEEKLETVHVKNTGRCRELLVPGAQVTLVVSNNPNRKTAYDLIAVYKPTLGWVNIDSQAPNAVVREWLETEAYTKVKAEYTWGNSRFDFYMERGEKQYLLEVKGCTLERDFVGYFPDAPTTRGVKHLQELTKAQQEGLSCAVAFVIQMERVWEVRPNITTDPDFARALEEAKAAGVAVLFLPCLVMPDTLTIDNLHIRRV